MLRLEGVSKRFPNGFLAVSAVDLEVGSGEIVAVIGGSGCGKSTLLRLIAGLEPATAGTAYVAGHPVTGPGADVGVVFQEPRLMPWLSVEANVRFGLHGTREHNRLQAAEALERVGLGGFADALPRELSGGMAQRAAIARALVGKPSVLLLDEPFSALDAFTRLDLQDHLLEVWDWYRPTLLMVTHDLDEAVVLADRVGVMSGRPGRLVADVTVDLARPRLRTDPAFHQIRHRILTGLGDARGEPVPVTAHQPVSSGP